MGKQNGQSRTANKMYKGATQQKQNSNVTAGDTKTSKNPTSI